MTEPRSEEVLEHAVHLFLRLSEAPEDKALVEERDAFLARGPLEREAFAKAQNAWRATKPKRRSGSLKTLVLLMITAAAAYFFAGDLRVMVLADLRTGMSTEAARLASGDAVTLDANSALADDTDGAVRQVTLLRGAGFFDVAKDGRPFTVTAGGLQVEVIGTAFETAHIGDAVSVTVASGQVSVSANGTSWTLNPGERLIWSAESGGILDKLETSDVASWRGGQLVVRGMTFAQVASILDRRVPGSVMVLGDDLASSRIVGTFDLDDPLAALRSLAAIRGATVTAAPPVVTVVRP
ncbi:MAG: FecR domain-containing protein [Pseudomonadota bacterium]